MKLLIIGAPQEKQTVNQIETALKDRCLIEITYSLDEAEYLLEHQSYDLLIPCLLSNALNTQLCKKIRKKQIHTPILLIIHNYHVLDKVAAIDAGADGYLSQPLHMMELFAHIKALTRRGVAKQVNDVLQIEDLKLDRTNKEVKRGKKQIRLRRKEYDLLEYFMRNPNRIITRDMILNNVWSNTYDSYTNTIDVHVKYLRDQIDKPFSKKLIKTIHGFGYKLETKLVVALLYCTSIQLLTSIDWYCIS